MRDRGRAARLIAALALASPAARGDDATGAPPSPAPQDVAPQDVVVHGTRHDIGATTLGGAEVRQVPGAFGDAFRSIDALPGVTPIVSGLPYFFVRGAPPGNVGYFIDGVRVPLLYHLGFGPSVIHPGLVDRVDFYPGGYPARFGRFAGGILSANLAEPKDHLHGEANLRVFDAGALVEGPFGEDDRGHAMVGGRFGYPGLVLPIFAPDTHLAYWDYQTREVWKLGDRDRVSVFAFGSYDDLSQRDASTRPFHDVLGTQFHRVDLRYDHDLPNGGHVRLAATVGRDESHDDHSGVSDDMLALRAEIDAPVHPKVRVRGGVDTILDRYDLQASVVEDARLLYPPRDDVNVGAWTDVVWRPTPRVEIVPGLRGDVFNSHRLDHPPINLRAGFDPGKTGLDHSLTESSIPTIEPRLAVRATVARGATWISTFGLTHQRPSFFVPVPGLQISELKPSLQTSIQASQGIELALPAEITATVTGFLHEYLNMTDITETCPSGDRSGDVRQLCTDDRVRGRAYGVEVFVRRALTRKLTGWISYTLSRTERQARAFSEPNATATWIPSEFDRPHVVSVVGAYDLGRGWRAGGRFFLDSGRPYSQTYLGVALPPYDGLRLPTFWRLDVRLEKRWRVSDTVGVAAVLEGLNVTLNKEAVSVSCTPGGGLRVDKCVPTYVGPVTIPSVGVEAYW